jgi:hypothetical protein
MDYLRTQFRDGAPSCSRIRPDQVWRAKGKHMIGPTWIALSARERRLILRALSTIRDSDRPNRSEIDALSTKLSHAQPHPDIRIGVHRGQVDCVAGNPFPIRIYDYDVEGDEVQDCDEQGRPCRTWLEPANDGQEAK